MGRFGQFFLEIKIFGAVLVGAVLSMGRFGIDPPISSELTSESVSRFSFRNVTQFVKSMYIFYIF